MQNIKDIQTLLDKYWLGETTLEEERLLKAYFATPLVDERFRPVAPLFQTLRQEQAVRLERAEVIPMPAQYSVRSRWAVAAAVVALLAMGGWWLFGPQPVTEVAATPSGVLPDTAIPMSAPAKAVNPAPSPVPATVPTLAERPAPKPKPAVKRKKPAPAAIDPETELAMEEIKAALALVSSKINKGKKAAIKDINQLENMDKFLKPKSDS